MGTDEFGRGEVLLEDLVPCGTVHDGIIRDRRIVTLSDGAERGPEGAREVESLAVLTAQKGGEDAADEGDGGWVDDDER